MLLIFVNTQKCLLLRALVSDIVCASQPFDRLIAVRPHVVRMGNPRSGALVYKGRLKGISALSACYHFGFHFVLTVVLKR